MTARGAAGDRIAGGIVVVFAAVLWFVVIPDQVDAVDYGWMRPQTLPGICAAALGLFGLLLIVLPSRRRRDIGLGQGARLLAIIALVAFALWAMSWLGFLWVAPPLAALLVVLLGERRWTWGLGAVAGVPAAIWLVVVALLHRPLP